MASKRKEKVIREGYLVKSPPPEKALSQWKKRYFVLWSSKALEYYISSEKKPQDYLKTLDLNHCEDMVAPLTIQKRTNIIKLMIREREKVRDYHLQCEGVPDLNMWVDCFAQVLGFTPVEDYEEEEMEEEEVEEEDESPPPPVPPGRPQIQLSSSPPLGRAPLPPTKRPPMLRPPIKENKSRSPPPLPPPKPGPSHLSSTSSYSLASSDVCEEEYEIPQLPLDMLDSQEPGDLYEALDLFQADDLNKNPPPIWRRERRFSPPPPLPNRLPLDRLAKTRGRETPPLLPARRGFGSANAIDKLVSDATSNQRAPSPNMVSHPLHPQTSKKKKTLSLRRFRKSPTDKSPAHIPYPSKSDSKKPVPIPPYKPSNEKQLPAVVSNEHQDTKTKKGLPPLPPGKSTKPSMLPVAISLKDDPKFTKKLQERREELYGQTDVNRNNEEDDVPDYPKEDYEEVIFFGDSESTNLQQNSNPSPHPPVRPPMKSPIGTRNQGGGGGDGSRLPEEYLEFEKVQQHNQSNVPPVLPKSVSLKRSIEESLKKEFRGRLDTPPLPSKDSKPQPLAPFGVAKTSSKPSSRIPPTLPSKEQRPKLYGSQRVSTPPPPLSREPAVSLHHRQSSDPISPPPPLPSRDSSMKGGGAAIDPSPPPPVPRRDASRHNFPVVELEAESPPPIPRRHPHHSDRPSIATTSTVTSRSPPDQLDNPLPVPLRAPSPAGRGHSPLPPPEEEVDDAPPVPTRGASKAARAADTLHTPHTSSSPHSHTPHSHTPHSHTPQSGYPVPQRSSSGGVQNAKTGLSNSESFKRPRPPITPQKPISNGDAPGISRDKPLALPKQGRKSPELQPPPWVRDIKQAKKTPVQPPLAKPEKEPPPGDTPPWKKDRRALEAPQPWVKPNQLSPERQPETLPPWVKQNRPSPERQPEAPPPRPKPNRPSPERQPEALPPWVKPKQQSPERQPLSTGGKTQPAPPSKSKPSLPYRPGGGGDREPPAVPRTKPDVLKANRPPLTQPKPCGAPSPIRPAILPKRDTRPKVPVLPPKR